MTGKASLPGASDSVQSPDHAKIKARGDGIRGQEPHRELPAVWINSAGRTNGNTHPSDDCNV